MEADRVGTDAVAYPVAHFHDVASQVYMQGMGVTLGATSSIERKVFSITTALKAAGLLAARCSATAPPRLFPRTTICNAQSCSGYKRRTRMQLLYVLPPASNLGDMQIILQTLKYNLLACTQTLNKRVCQSN